MGNDANPAADDTAERLARMLRIPTVSADRERREHASEAHPFADFRALLRELYPLLHEHTEHEIIDPDGLVFRWRGTDASLAPVVCMAHYDVVPADDPEQWQHAPFDGTIADDFVWGRGALDDKGALCVLLDAVEALMSTGHTPPRDIVISLGGDEEVSGVSGRAIAASFRERSEVPWLVLDEGGAVVDAPLPFLDTPAAMIGVAEKGIMTVRLRVRGSGGHASAPPAMSTIGRLARAIHRLERRPFPAKATTTLMVLLDTFRAQATGRGAAILRALGASAPLTAQAFAKLGGEPAALVRTTVAPTMIEGGTAANVLAPEATATLNLRIAPGESVSEVMRGLRRRIRDREVALELVAGEPPTDESAIDSPQWRAIGAAVDAAWPGLLAAPYVMMAATDSRHWHRFAPAVYRFAPLEMPGDLRSTIHAVDERVPVATLARGVEFWRALLTSIPGAES